MCDRCDKLNTLPWVQRFSKAADNVIKFIDLKEASSQMYLVLHAAGETNIKKLSMQPDVMQAMETLLLEAASAVAEARKLLEAMPDQDVQEVLKEMGGSSARRADL